MSKKQRTRNLYEKIKQFVLNENKASITKEYLAERYGAREHEVSSVLSQLNREGLLSQAHHPRCEDRGVPRCNVWLRDYYEVLNKIEPE